MALKVFITGASSGIGEALAVYYAAQGATLGLAARRGDRLDQLNQRLGGQHACYALDVSDAPAVHAAATDFVGRFGAPDIIIASAGVSAGTLTEYEADLEVFRRVMDINVFGLAATFAPFIPALKAAGGAPRLVGIASVAGIRGLPGAEAYSASKAAAIAYLESLRLEMRPYGIQVVTIAPGYIETPMTALNPYKMPFLMPPQQAAERFAAAIARGTSYTVIPWQMGIVAKVLRALPNWLYDRLFVKAPRKPRGLDLGGPAN
ncbi:SDR family oxidoreductase [Dechloromonas denitrificans]|uniref:SDR family oxidoreductase n=1 Tax=Dechloromonas denitrificans TaxID=281362 RepID=UPI001CF89501|nr:SDR family oxidoreductase [Dechloromonas denitrificans]UCV03371.1 SDR family oxidoreductase [Dechloromonas denitrificans]